MRQILFILFFLYINISSQHTNYKTNKLSLNKAYSLEKLGNSVSSLFIDHQADGRFSSIFLYDSVFTSIDDGASWQPATLNIDDGPRVSFFSFAFNPSHPDTAYLAAGVDLMKSVDRGFTWDTTSMFTDFYDIHYVTYHQYNSNIIFVSNAFPHRNEVLLYKSMDGGGTWKISDQEQYTKLVFDFSNEKIIYGIRGYTDLRKTNDGGESWEDINNNLVYFYDNTRVLEISKIDPSILYCGQYFNDEYETWRLSISKNSGDSWERIDSTLIDIDPEGSVYSVHLDPNVEGRFYISYSGGLYLTEDNGKHYEQIYSGNVWNIWSDEKSPSKIYFSSDEGLYRITDTLTVGIKEHQVKYLISFNLTQNYPNPFNPTTNITYQLPHNARVKLVVYNSLGQVVNTLVDQNKSAGRYSITFNASNLPSGVYFYRIQAGDYVSVKKMLLMK